MNGIHNIWQHTHGKAGLLFFVCNRSVLQIQDHFPFPMPKGWNKHEDFNSSMLDFNCPVFGHSSLCNTSVALGFVLSRPLSVKARTDSEAMYCVQL